MAKASVKITANSSDYQRQMKEMVQQMKSLGSEFSLTATRAKLFGSQSDVLKAKVSELTQKVELQKKMVQANGEQYERLSSQLSNQKTKHEELKRKIEETKKAHQDSVKATGEDSEASKELKANLDQLNDELKKNETAISKTESSLTKQKTKTDASTKALLEMERGLQEVSRKLKDAGLDAFAEKCDKVAKGADKVAKKTAGISGAAALLEVAAAKSAMSFEDSMAKVSTIMDENVMSTGEMKKAIMDLSNETGIASTDIAENVYNAISAGQQTGDAVNFVREATKLATAGFADSASSLDILTTIMNSYGLEASEVSKVSDMLIQTQNLGKTTVGELSTSMGKVIPTAKAFGVGLDQVNTSYVKLTSNGIATAESTTYLNAMLNELGKTGSISDKILREKTGKSFTELMASGSSLGDVLAILDEEAKSQNVQFTDMFSSSEAAKAGLVLIKDGADGFNSTLQQMNGSTGMTDEAFQKMQTNSFNLKKTFNEVKNSVIEFGTAFLTAMQPAIQTVREKISELTTWFNNLDDKTKQNIATAGLLVAAIAPVAKWISTVAKGVKGAIEIYGAFSKAGSKVISMLKSEKAAQIAKKVVDVASTAATGAMTAAQAAFNAVMNANPIILVVTAIAALVAGMVLAYNKCEWFRNLVNSIFEWIKQAIGTVASAISGAWENIKTATMNVWNAISTTISNVWNTITSVVQLGIDLIASILEAAFLIITLPFQFIWENCKETITNVWNAITTNVSNFINSVKETISNVMNAIKEKISAVWTTISTNVSNFVNGIKTTISNIWNSISTTISNVMTTISTKVSSVWNTISSSVSGVVNRIKTTVSNVWNSITSAISGALNSAKAAVSNVWDAISSKISNTINGIKTTVSNVFNTIKNTISSAINGAKDIVSGAIDKIKSFFNFHVEFPHIKLPHFKVKGSANPLKWLDEGVPRLSVEWYANGGIMTKPTAFGMAGNRMLAGGEAGAEAILPLAYFYQELARIIDEKIAKVKVQAFFKVEAHTYIGDDEVANKTAVKVSEIMAEEYEGAR